VHIVVIIKQVPEIGLVRVNESAGTVELPSGPGVVNPFDEYALEEGLRIKDRISGSKVTALTVGADKAESALRQALAIGVDEAILVSDDAFQNSDPQAVGKILAAAVKKIGDTGLVLAGKQAIDDDSAQVPGAVAAHLDWPQVMFVKKTEDIAEDSATFLRTTEEGHDAVKVKLPAVVSVVKEINEPRLPSLKGKMAAKKAQITKWSGGDIGLTETGVGKNSPTSTLSAAPLPPRKKGEIIEGETAEEIADRLIAKLREDQAI
jgi:electron transfer flavoprotein beta subunit